MNIKFVLLTSLFLFSAPLAFASETGPSKPTAEGLGVCGICLEEILPTQLGTDALISGRELYGCDERHLFHRDCILDKHGRPKTPICPYCRATRDEPAAKTNEDALTAYHSGQFAAPWEGAPEQVRTQTPLQRARAALVAMEERVGIQRSVWHSVLNQLSRSGSTELSITSFYSPFDESYSELRTIINVLPQIIKESITRLNLSRNHLTDLPDAIGQLTGLQELDLSFNNLSKLPEAVGQLTGLRKLSLFGNYLSELNSLRRLTGLQELHLSDNHLTSLPDAILQLTSLGYLDLSGNHLTSLPDAIRQLTGLRELDLRGNRLTSLPDTLAQLPNLQRLRIDRGVKIPALRPEVRIT